jgi:glycine betaine/choline ABC-type transport system substrate-binding protein
MESTDDGGFLVVIVSLPIDVVPSHNGLRLDSKADEVVIAADSGVELFIIDNIIELLIKTHRYTTDNDKLITPRCNRRIRFGEFN